MAPYRSCFCLAVACWLMRQSPDKPEGTRKLLVIHSLVHRRRRVRRLGRKPRRRMLMRSHRNACWVVVVVAISLMTSSMADARSIHHRRLDHSYPRAAYDAVGD